MKPLRRNYSTNDVYVFDDMVKARFHERVWKIKNCCLSLTFADVITEVRLGGFSTTTTAFFLEALSTLCNILNISYDLSFLREAVLLALLISRSSAKRSSIIPKVRSASDYYTHNL